MDREHAESVIRDQRRAFMGAAVFRGIVWFLFLLAAMRAFPTHRSVVVLGALFIATSFDVVLTHADLQEQVERYRADRAERMTRHAITLSHQWAWSHPRTERAPIFPADFWNTVRDQLDDELGPALDREPAWKGLRAVCLDLFLRVVANIGSIGIAYALAGGG